jgi:hypothetical protein
MDNITSHSAQHEFVRVVDEIPRLFASLYPLESSLEAIMLKFEIELGCAVQLL